MTKYPLSGDLLDTIGNTPLIRLERITRDLEAGIFAKLEFLNPFGSVKDRTVKHMIEVAERDGRIRPGDTIIENSSGNTALALAAICALKGYRLKIVIRDNLGEDKVKFLRAMNVDIVTADHTLPPESPESYNNLAQKIAAETPGAFYLDQHNNRENNDAHYYSTGPEIWEQMEGRIDYFVAGIGTGGTVCGAGRYLKQRDPSIRVVAVDPVGSVFYGYFHNGERTPPAPFLMEGLGDEFLIGCADFEPIDDILQVTDRDAFRMTRRLALEESVLAGGSSGAALWGAMEIARRHGGPSRIVTLFPDSANRYLSTIYNDDWLRSHGLLESETTSR